MKIRLAENLSCVVLLLTMGCSAAKKLGSFGIPDPLEKISVQRAPAAIVSIKRIKEKDKYDFYISLLDEAGEPSRTYIVRGLREQAKAQFHRDLNSVIINDEGKAQYALVVDRDIEYRPHSDDVK